MPSVPMVSPRRLLVTVLAFGLLAVVALWGLATVSADRTEAIIYYSDRASFNAANPGLPLENFEAGLVTSGNVLACPEPFNSASPSNACFNTGTIAAGVTLQDSYPGASADGLALVGPAVSGSTSKSLVTNDPTYDYELYFSPAVNVVGVDLMSFTSSDVVNIILYDTFSTTLATITATTSTAGDFWGVRSDTLIGKMTLQAIGGQQEGVDNLAFGPAAFAPVFTSSPSLTATEDILYTYAISSTDQNVGQALTITAPTKPAWLTLTPTGNGAATLSGTPLNAHVGPNPVVLMVQDSVGLTATQSFTITVVNVNDTPTFASVPNTAATEDVAYSYVITTTDVDAGDVLTLTAPVKPAWVTFTDNGNGLGSLTGTPTNAEVGNWPVALQVRDVAGAIANQFFTITVSNVNDPPTFTSSPITSATEDVAYTYNITTNDIDVGDVLTLTAPTKPAWLAFTDNGNGQGSLTGTPLNADVGPHAVTLRVRDVAGVIISQTFTVTVANVNDAPTFTSPPVTSATEDVAYTYTITTNDVDAGDVLTLTAPVKPAWVTFTDNGNGLGSLTGTPTNAQVGAYSVTLQVRDTTGVTTTQSFTLTVLNTNDPPAFTSSPITSATEEVLYTYAITTLDIDVGDVLTITAPLRPAWLTLTDNGNGTASLSGTPTNAQVGQHPVTLQVRDTAGITDTQSFTITVVNVNDAPTFVSAPPLTGTETVLYTYPITTTDVDAGDVLTLTAPTKPAWLTFTDNGNGLGSLSGTPANSDIGPHVVVLQVRDASGVTTTQAYTLTVFWINTAPTFTSAPVTSATEDQAYAYNITATDADISDTLTFSATTKPAWLTLTDNGNGTASLSGTPTNANVGPNPVVLQVRDLVGATDTQAFTITVSNVNDPPLFTSTPITTASEDVTYAYAITVTDVDAGDLITITAPARPAWLTFTDNGNGTATLAGTPTNADIGVHTVVLLARDIANAQDSQTFSITVSNVNDAPIFTSAPIITATEDVAYAYTITTSDVDAGDALTLTAPAKPAWLTFSDNGNGLGSLTGTPTNAEVGPHAVVLQVRDTTGVTTTQAFTVTVINVNDAPAFTSTPITLAMESVPYTYTITTTDVDAGDVLTLTAPTKPAWLTFTDSGNGAGLLFATPALVDVGSYSVTLQVRDTAGLTTTQSFTLTVLLADHSPTFVSSPPLTATAGVTYTYAITVSDIDLSNVLTITAVSKPAWLTLTDNGNRTGTLTGKPGLGDVGAPTITLRVTDNTGLSNDQTFMLTVRPITLYLPVVRRYTPLRLYLPIIRR